MNTSTKLLEELQEAIELFRDKQRKKAHLDRLTDELDQRYAELDVQQKKMDKEYSEYESLEKGNMKGLFYKILGNKKQQLEKERQEYLDEMLRYDQLKENIKLVEFELNVIKDKANGLELAEENVVRLKKARERSLLSGNSPGGARLRELLKFQDRKTIVLKDCKEILAVADKCLQRINQLIHYLYAAKDWGYNNQRQRGWSSHSRQGHIDMARKIAYQLQQDLNHFDREMRDIYDGWQGMSGQLPLPEMQSFVSILFQNLITDWIYRQKIQKSINEVQAFKQQLLHIVDQVKTHQTEEREHFNKAKSEQESIITYGFSASNK